MRRLILALSALGLTAVGLAGPASAQYPDRPVKMIVPWAAGGDTDNIFRPLAPVLQKHLGQTVVIANVGGASGTVGAREAKSSPADGYTVYAMHDYIHLVHYAGLTDITYKDFEPICLRLGDALRADRQPQDAVEDLEGARRRRQEAAGRDHGRRHAGLDQPHLPGLGREGGRHQVQVRILRGPRPAHERHPGRPHRPHRLQPHPEGQGRRRASSSSSPSPASSAIPTCPTCRRSRSSA